MIDWYYLMNLLQSNHHLALTLVPLLRLQHYYIPNLK